MTQPRVRKPPPPFDSEALERAALRYVERFQTTRARLVRHLAAKLRLRGWEGAAPPDLEGLADRLAARGFIDEAAYAEARARGMKARGLGPRRIAARLRADGVAVAEPPGPDAGEAAEDPDEAERLALAFARRRRLGPFGPPAADPRARARQMAAMLRAGHAPDLAVRILALPAEEAERLLGDS